jgi:hypothetical protein
MYITATDSKNYKSLIILNELINGTSFRTILNGDDKLLEPLFIELMSKSYVQVRGINYEITQKGIDTFDVFMKRYKEYLKYYDVFGFVDLEKGEFAFSKYFDFDTDDKWNIFKSDSRFDDLRIAVAMYKNINPAEIVFMSFLNENRFDTQKTGWQIDMLSDMIWEEIETICLTAIKSDELGQDVIEDVIKQGTDLMMSLLEEENKKKQLEVVSTPLNEEIIEEYETVSYYEPYYYDPFYVSPIWIAPLFIW